jgi:hypothetical protein
MTPVLSKLQTAGWPADGRSELLPHVIINTLE